QDELLEADSEDVAEVEDEKQHDDRAHARQRDVPGAAEATGTVRRGRLVQRGVDRRQCCEEDDHPPARVLPGDLPDDEEREGVGVGHEGDRVITTSIEHNSMRRPLEYINNRYGVDVVYVKWNDDEEQFVTDIEKKITSRTKMLAITHASNVTGSVIPLYRLLRIAKRRDILT